jgi:hypothetical protein
VTFARPVEHGIDDTLTHHAHGDWWIRAATPERRCLSPEAAHEEVIALVRDADARRHRED